MSRLFTELYTDEDVSALLTKLLRSRGFVVTSAQEAGLLGRSDEEQLAHAAGQRKALLTHNRVHFEALVQQYHATGRTHYATVGSRAGSVNYFGFILAHWNLPHRGELESTAQGVKQGLECESQQPAIT